MHLKNSYSLNVLFSLLNFEESLNFWGAQTVAPPHASAVKVKYHNNTSLQAPSAVNGDATDSAAHNGVGGNGESNVMVTKASDIQEGGYSYGKTFPYFVLIQQEGLPSGMVVL